MNHSNNTIEKGKSIWFQTCHTKAILIFVLIKYRIPVRDVQCINLNILIAAPVYESKWFAFKQMMFLLNKEEADEATLDSEMVNLFSTFLPFCLKYYFLLFIVHVVETYYRTFCSRRIISLEIPK